MKIRVLTIAAIAVFTSGTVSGQEFPLNIPNKFGVTEITVQPQRVATVDRAGADNVLALGFQPLTAWFWFGPYENALWPWAQERSTVDPEVLHGGLDYEQVASTNPDVILAMRSGITQDDYDKLSLIAPVVAVPEGRGDWDLDWEEQAALVGLALGRSEEAAEQIQGVKDLVAETAAAHPEWADATFASMTYWDGSVRLYTVTDSAVSFIASLGIAPHPKVVELSTPGEAQIAISEELLPELDADVIFWYASPDSPEIAGLVAREYMRAPAEGREVFLSLDSRLNGALSHGSLLSLNDAVEHLVPTIEAAIDGDPATEVPLF